MTDKEEKIQVYFMPGLATDSSIFENIKLPADRFEIHYLEWIIPLKKETLQEYVYRMLKYIKHKDSVLIGVSFGGVIVQEICKHIDVKRVIIISSVKCRDELPKRLKFAAKTGSYKLVPTSLLHYVDHFEKLAPNEFLKKRARLYKRYLAVRNKVYLDWAIEKMVCWNCETPGEDIVHIHGDKDLIFPYKNINNCITVKGGTHIMIINRYKWFNRYLPELIVKGEITEDKTYKDRKNENI